MTRFTVFCWLWWILLFIAPAVVQAGVPAAACRVGYCQLTFSSGLGRSDVAPENDDSPGYSWYPWSFFGEHASERRLEFARNGALTLLGEKTGPNGELASAVVASNKQGFVGSAFGGGAYIEATLSFEPQDVKAAGYDGHPSFWAMSIEHLIPRMRPQESVGHGPYEHFGELDVFEYDVARYVHAPNVYGAGIHDWYGVWNSTCPPALCQVASSDVAHWLPRDVHLNQFHEYGALWVPATANTQGYIQFYFDERPVGKQISWSYCAKSLHPGQRGYSPFCVLDRQHLVLILGTGVGEPMTVKDVRVFQASARDDIVN